MRRNLKQQHGFTLTEVAIVLGIVGLILGGIWTAAATVYQQKDANDLIRQLNQVIGNAQNFYYNSPPQLGSTFQQRNQAEFMAGIFPADFITSNLTGAENYFQTTQGYWFHTIASPENPAAGFPADYDIEFYAWPSHENPVPENICIPLLMALGQRQDVEFFDTFTGDWAPNPPDPEDYSFVGPMTPGTAAALCSDQTATDSQLNLFFYLQP